MTDKTDIAALSSKIVHQLMDLGCADEGVEERSLAFVSGIISKAFDAERQQREAAEATLNSLGYTHSPGASLWKPPLGKVPNFNLVDAYINRAEAAEKERDALKSAHSNMVTRCALLRQRTDLPVDRIPAYNSLVKAQDENAALKAKLANPVVLPAGYVARAGHPFHEGERNVMIPNKHGDWLSRIDVEHAIHVAGFPFTVKGE